MGASGIRLAQGEKKSKCIPRFLVRNKITVSDGSYQGWGISRNLERPSSRCFQSHIPLQPCPFNWLFERSCLHQLLGQANGVYLMRK